MCLDVDEDLIKKLFCLDNLNNSVFSNSFVHMLRQSYLRCTKTDMRRIVYSDLKLKSSFNYL